MRSVFPSISHINFAYQWYILVKKIATNFTHIAAPMRKIQTQNDNPVKWINNRNQSCDIIRLSHWLFGQMSIFKTHSALQVPISWKAIYCWTNWLHHWIRHEAGSTLESLGRTQRVAEAFACVPGNGGTRSLSRRMLGERVPPLFRTPRAPLCSAEAFRCGPGFRLQLHSHVKAGEGFTGKARTNRVLIMLESC